MNRQYTEALQKLPPSGWTLEYFSQRQTLPDSILKRYSWLPEEERRFMEEIKTLSNRNQTAWFLTAANFWGTSNSAYVWNEWEILSLDVANGDPHQQDEIKQFWDHHLPLMMSIKSGYDSLALEEKTLQVIGVEESAFEEAVIIAPSLLDLLHLLALPNHPVQRWA